MIDEEEEEWNSSSVRVDAKEQVDQGEDVVVKVTSSMLGPTIDKPKSIYTSLTTAWESMGTHVLLLGA